MSTRGLGAWLRGHAYAVFATALLAFLLAAFLVAEALRPPLLADPVAALRDAGPIAAVVGVGLLLVDVVLPVPASVVMIANGALFGFAAGTALSFVGGLGATLVAFAVGRRSRALFRSRIDPEQEQRASALLARYGALAIVVSRPVPIVAETVAVLAGRSALSWRTATLAGAAGALVPAALYAAAGAVATTVSGAVVFVGLIAVAVIFWLAGRDAATRAAGDAEAPADGAPARPDGAPENAL